MTYLMKFKPIDVGYKFFALNDSKTGWCYVVIPEGLADEEKEGKDGKKTWDKVADLCRHLPDRKNKQYVACMDNYFTYPKTIRALANLGVATVGTARPSTMPPEIRDRAQKKSAEEKKEYKPLKAGQKEEKEDAAQAPSIRIKDKRYNTFHFMDSHDGVYWCFCWIDNNVVKMVSNIHTGNPDEVVSRTR